MRLPGYSCCRIVGANFCLPHSIYKVNKRHTSDTRTGLVRHRNTFKSRTRAKRNSLLVGDVTPDKFSGTKNSQSSLGEYLSHASASQKLCNIPRPFIIQTKPVFHRNPPYCAEDQMVLEMGRKLTQIGNCCTTAIIFLMSTHLKQTRHVMKDIVRRSLPAFRKLAHSQ